jgi:1-deoxy-D-xylulose-5-phosphate reductoisomerase
LANKESLVCGSGLLPEVCERHGTTLLPVDSEHSAIYQLLRGERQSEVERVILTASGGPFRDFSLEQMAQATPEEAACHPNWDMGLRISIDSASMFNKAMELIEAKELFGFRPDQLEVLVHPQSLIHSLVGYCDGAMVAHVGPPDMRAAIGYALNWPERSNLPVERLDLGRIGRMDFHAPDPERFPAIALAFEAMRIGGAAGTVFNAAKEAALDLFLQRRIGFLDMATYTERALEAFSDEVSGLNMSFENVAQTDAEVRRYVSEL